MVFLTCSLPLLTFWGFAVRATGIFPSLIPTLYWETEGRAPAPGQARCAGPAAVGWSAHPQAAVCHEGLFYVTDLFFKSMFKLINIFFTKRKNCVDYIHILYFFVCVCILVLVTPKLGTQPARWVVCQGGWEHTNFCIKLWILTRGFIWTLGLGKQSQHCQDSIGTSTQKTQLLLPTLHISLHKKRKCKNWNFLQ